MNITKPVSIALGLALALGSAVTPATAKISVPRSATPVIAQSASAGTVSAATVTQLSNSQAAAILKRMGFEYKASEKSPKSLIFTLDGYKVVLINYTNSIQLYTGFKTDGKVSLDTINAWNRKIRFSRAYLDDENDAVIETDLELKGGVTNAAIDEFIRTFRISVRDFAKHAGV